jgi:xyloglucan-specific exo-beta-1,4-glucanase
MIKTLSVLAIAASLSLVSLAPLPQARAQTAAYNWQQIRLGAGGFVTGLVVHPTTTTLKYARTDVGGIYRWETWGAWTPLTDGLTETYPGAASIESVALDRLNSQVVYIASDNTVFKSTNRGGQWTRLNINVATNGNAPWRSTGERLAVDPSNSNNVYFGTRSNGLWRSTNGGTSWSQVTIPNTGTAGIGVTFVAFDRRVVSGAVVQRIYIGVAGGGVYRSTNGGSGWQLLTGGPTTGSVPQRIAIDSTGRGFITYANQSSWDAPGGGSIWRAAANSTALTEVTPKNASGQRLNGQGYGGISVHPTNSNFLMVGEWRFSGGCSLYRTTDGGTSWTRITNNPSGMPWIPSYGFSTGPAAIVIDPEAPTQTWMTDGFAPWRTDDNRWDTAYWYTWPTGLEEFVPSQSLRPAGSTGDRLLAGVNDMVGFTQTNYGALPPVKWEPEVFGDATGMDLSPDKNWVYRVTRVGSGTTLSISYNRGDSWDPLPNPNLGVAGRVAVSATGGDNLVTIGAGWAAPKFSWGRGYDGWQNASFPDGSVYLWNPGAGDGAWHVHSQPLAADRVQPGTFYLYGNNSRLYRSTTGGQSWTLQSSGQLPWDYRQTLKAAPHRAGELWINFTAEVDGNNGGGPGMYRSFDGGASFTRLARIASVQAFGFGKAAPGRTGTSTVYVYGVIDGVKGLFRSDDAAQTTGNGSAATWVRINANRPLPNVGWSGIEADRDTYGVVYIGCGGRGYFVGRPQ